MMPRLGEFGGASLRNYCCYLASCASLRLDCPSIAHWDYVGIFAVEVRFQIRDQFWIPKPKLHEAKYLIFL